MEGVEECWNPRERDQSILDHCGCDRCSGRLSGVEDPEILQKTESWEKSNW